MLAKLTDLEKLIIYCTVHQAISVYNDLQVTECKLASLLSHYGVLLSSVSCRFKTETFQVCGISDVVGKIWSILFYDYYKSVNLERKFLLGSEVWYVAGN